MGFVGTILEALLLLPRYVWSLTVSGWLSLSYVYEFLHLVLTGRDAKDKLNWIEWLQQRIRLERVLSYYRYYLPVAGIVLVHFLVHSFMTRFRIARRPDRVIWASLSTGIATAWMYVFRETLPFGRMGLYTLTPVQQAIVHAHAQSLYTFLVCYYGYTLVTGLTTDKSNRARFGNRPGGFFVRKFIPVFAVIVYSVARARTQSSSSSPLANPSLAGWLLRVLFADAITDVVVAANERLSAVCLIVWTVAVGSAFNEYALYMDTALGLFPCIVIAGMAMWAYVAQIKSEYR